MDWLVPLSDLDYGPAEDQAVLDVLHSKWLTMGAVTQQFEAAFAAMTGSKYAFAVSNATQALHLACSALGLGPGDEVILPSLTFVATANAVLYTGAAPVFADIIGPEDLTVDPADIEAKITPRTRAIIVMHYAGYPCRMPEILAIAGKHGLPVIEDAAHAPGASLNRKPLGAWGDVGCFSFFSNKNLATGEGGMLVTNRDDVAAKVRLQRSHGMTTLTYDRHKGHAHSYDVVDLGYNYRIDEIHSALGLVQLAKLAANNARRAELTRLYWDLLHDTPLTLPFRAQYEKLSSPSSPSSFSSPTSPLVPSVPLTASGALTSVVVSKSSYPAFHIFPILLPPGVDREAFIEHMHAARIQTSIHYTPVHLFSYYRQHLVNASLPVTEDAAAREVTLPLYPIMRNDLLQAVVDGVMESLRVAL
jgi:dTDP-4-amino-4,6-dideoxygalactose transaminase